MACFSGGEITDTVWPSRFGYLKALSAFGVLSSIKENTAHIYRSKITSGSAYAPDLRGGMACLMTALAASGQSEIRSLDTILRGYENLDKKLCAIGADIKIIDT
jgi:UDP-N-acetylglucosamine 1-carboxyvinyltransferase